MKYFQYLKNNVQVSKLVKQTCFTNHGYILSVITLTFPALSHTFPATRAGASAHGNHIFRILTRSLRPFMKYCQKFVIDLVGYAILIFAFAETEMISKM